MLVAEAVKLATMPNMVVAAEVVEMRVRPLVVLPQAARRYSVRAAAAVAVLAVHRMVPRGAHGGRGPMAVEVKPILAITTLAIPMNLAVATEAEEDQTLMKGEPVESQAARAAAAAQLLAMKKGAVLVLEAKSGFGHIR